MERVWKVLCAVVVVVALVFTVLQFTQGETGGAVITLLMAAVAAVFFKAGWSGKGLRRRS